MNETSKKFNDLIIHTPLTPNEVHENLESTIQKNQEVGVLIVDNFNSDNYNSVYNNGLDLTRETKRRFPKVKTILITNEPVSLDIAVDSLNDKSVLDAYCDKRLDNYLDILVPQIENCIKDFELIHFSKNTSLKGKHILITGASGFIGRKIVQYFFEKTDTILYLLGRSKKEVSFEDRVGIHSDRIKYIESDLTADKIIKNKSDLHMIENFVEEIWHLAASTDFDEKKRAETLNINILGVINIISLAKGIKKLKCFNHVSTAYISGEVYYPDVVEETIPFTPRFRNCYEESKYYGEIIISNCGIPFRVFRPSMVIGDSETGDCDTKTIYGAATLLYIAKMRYGKQQNEFTIAGDENVRKNLIPVNSVVDMMMKIRDTDYGLNERFNIVNSKYATLIDILSSIADKLDIKLIYDPSFNTDKIKNEADAFLYRSFSQFIYYMTLSDPEFSMKNTLTALPDYKIPTPDRKLINFCFNKFYSEKLPQILKH